MLLASAGARRSGCLEAYSGWGHGDDPNELGYGRGVSKRHGAFWLHSQIVAYVFRLRADVRAAFRRQRHRELGWSRNGSHPPTVGVHVRRGDKSQDGSFAEYRDALETLRRSYGVRHVFMATDEPEAISACRR